MGGRKGGEAVRDKYGPGFYEEIGKKGGQKVRELIEQGKRLGRSRAAQSSEPEEPACPPSGGTGMNSSGRGE